MEKYEECKGRVRNLLRMMEASSADEGMAMLDAFVKDYEDSLFNEIGRLTRQLHDSLVAFQSDEKIHKLAREDIKSAKDRLKYVVDLTEQAAQKVIEVIEKSIPISLKIGEGANDLRLSLKDRKKATGQSVVPRKTNAFLVGTKRNAGILHGYLTEILMAQEYQDITGQIIKKVINLVQDVEDNLVRLIKLTGRAYGAQAIDKSGTEPSGPCVPRVDDESLYTTRQDDVDQLLASLGF